MGLTPTHPRYSVDEYLRRERDSLDKHEYRDGEILLMAGSTPNHSLITANVIRERFRVRRQVRAMSAHGRITGWVLGLLPPALGGLLFLIAPEHMSPLIDDPFGRQLVAGALVLQIVGMVAIRRIVNVEF